MSYVPPAGNAISFDLTGTYASPAGDGLSLDLAFSQGGGGSGVLTSWANKTYTAHAPHFDIAQKITSVANVQYNTQAVGTGIVQSTYLSGAAGIVYTMHAPTGQSVGKILGTNATKTYTTYTPTLFNGKLTTLSVYAGITYTVQAPTQKIGIRKAFDLPYTIWHTTLDVSANLTYTPREPGNFLTVSGYWEAVYDIRDTEVPVKLDWAFVYGAREAWSFDLSWGLNSSASKAWDALYNIVSVDRIQKAWDIPYSARVAFAAELPYSLLAASALSVSWELPYSLRDLLAIAWGTPYTLTSPVSADFGVPYAIKSYDRVEKAVRVVYSIGGTSVIVETNQPYITYNGKNIRIVEGDISTSEGGYTWEGNFTLADVADYVQFAQDQPFTVNLYGEVYNFVVDGKELTRNGPAQISARLIGVSPSARFSSPRAVEQDYLWDTTITVLDAVNQVTANDISWGTVNWHIPGFRLGFDNAPALDVVKALAEAAGAVVESSKTGQLRVRPRYPISVPDYPVATPDQVYIETSDILSVSETYAIGEIYNKFRIADVDLAENDGLEWVPDYQGGLIGYMRCFPYPWRTDVNLIHTGDGTVYIGPQEVGYTEKDEVVEVYQGQGAVEYPIYAVLDVEMLGVNVGSITFSTDVREFTVSGPALNSVIRIRYRTRFLRYRVISGSGRPTQFLLESQPIP